MLLWTQCNNDSLIFWEQVPLEEGLNKAIHYFRKELEYQANNQYIPKPKPARMKKGRTRHNWRLLVEQEMPCLTFDGCNFLFFFFFFERDFETGIMKNKLEFHSEACFKEVDVPKNNKQIFPFPCKSCLALFKSVFLCKIE